MSIFIICQLIAYRSNKCHSGDEYRAAKIGNRLSSTMIGVVNIRAIEIPKSTGVDLHADVSS